MNGDSQFKGELSLTVSVTGKEGKCATHTWRAKPRLLKTPRPEAGAPYAARPCVHQPENCLPRKNLLSLLFFLSLPPSFLLPSFLPPSCLPPFIFSFSKLIHAHRLNRQLYKFPHKNSDFPLPSHFPLSGTTTSNTLSGLWWNSLLYLQK